MKIALNGLQLNSFNTGVQNYTQKLFEEIYKNKCYSIECKLIKPDKNKNNRLKRVLFENFNLESYLRNKNFSLYHATNYVLPYFFNFPSVLTIHDLITIDYPKLCQWESVLYFKLLLSGSIRKANKIIAVSDTVKNDILRHFPVSEDKIKVVYHGVSPIFKKTTDPDFLNQVRQKYQLPEKYILFVGNIEPKKNLSRLIQSFNKLRKSTELSHKLVIVGKKGWRYRPIYKTIERLKIGSEIIFTGYLPEEDLPALYSMADLFVFPSIYEGFGIPPLEAMACETPVLASNTGALPETTGGNCLMVDPYNVENIANGMHLLLSNEKLKNEYVKKGKIWAQQYTWERAARKTIEIYDKIGKKNDQADF